MATTAPRPLRLSHLTKPMRAALRQAHAQGLPIVRTGHHQRTIEALERRGLIHRRQSKKGRALWRPTDVGRGLLERPASPHRVQLLHKRSQYGYTSSPSHALPREPEAFRDAA